MPQRTTGERLQCSFCGKSQDEVRKLIAGPKVYICDQCVELCNDILADEYEEELHSAEEQPSGDPGPFQTGTALCALCGWATVMGLLVKIPDRGFLCFACLDAIRAVSEPKAPNGP